MMEALLRGRVDFVRLFLEQGLSLKRFLTFDRLEAMYNTVSAEGFQSRGISLIQFLPLI